MWVLRHLTGDVRFYLPPEKQNYTVGRSMTDFLLAKDTTISRRHASLVLKGDQLFVLDEGSKYKVFLNAGIEQKKAIAPKTEVELKKGDRVRFGQLNSEFVVDVVDICTLTSTLTSPLISDLEGLMKKVGGKIVNTPEENFTHLTMTTIVITAKQLQSLVLGIPIVTMEYWSDAAKAVKQHKPLPDVKKYLPEMGEELLKQSHHLFHVNTKRKSLFQDKIVYFFSTRHFQQYKGTIETAGGTALALDQKQNKVKKTQLVAATAFVVQYEASGHSQATQSIDAVGQHVRSKGLRLIPETEIQLAILHCSLQKYCNPKYKFQEHFAPLKFTKSDLLSKNTEAQASGSHQEKPSQVIVIPESVPPSEGVPHSIPLKESNMNEKAPVVDENKTRASTRLKRKLDVPEPEVANKVIVVEENDTPVGKRSTRRKSVNKQANVELMQVEQEPEVANKEIIVGDDTPVGRRSTRRKSVNKQANPEVMQVEQEPEVANKVIVVGEDNTPVGKRSTRRKSVNKQANPEVMHVAPEPLEQESADSNTVVEEIVPESEPAAPESQTSQSSFLLSWSAKETPAPVAKSTSEPSTDMTQSRRARRRANDDNDVDDDTFSCFASISKRQKTVNSPVTHISRASSFNESQQQQSRASRKRTANDDSLFQITEQSSLFKAPAPAPAIPQNGSSTSSVETTSVYKKQSPNQPLNALTRPSVVSTEGWLSASHIPHQPIKVEADLSESSEVEKKVADLFITEVKPMLLISRMEQERDSTDGISNGSTTFNSTKNFKGFVKKHNYKTQTKIIGQTFEIIGLTQLKF